jgi:hypothetical protein
MSMGGENSDAMGGDYWSSTDTATLMHRLLPRLVLFIGDVALIIADAIALLAATSQRFVPGRARPRPPYHVKPHPSCAYKG